MTADKTQGEGNRLIAEFDGWQSNKYHNLPNKLHKDIAGEEVGIAINQLEYHSSWDALMPVVEKIEASADSKTGHMEVHISEYHCTIYQFGHKQIARSCDGRLNKIQSVWETVIQFIQWYNTNSK